MKYIKKFETLNEKDFNLVKIGYYVIIKVDPGTGISQNVYNKIGKVVDIINNNLIEVYYEDTDFTLKYIHKSFIKHLSKDKKDLEILLNSEKYNI